MSDLATPSAEAACTRLCLDFVNGIDARDNARCVGTFSPDGVFEHLTGRMEGRDAVMRMLEGRPANMVTRHLCTNLDITQTGPAHARGVCYVAVLRGTSEDGKLPLPPVMPLFVEYHDEYALLDGRWYITHRKTVPVFV